MTIEIINTKCLFFQKEEEQIRIIINYIFLLDQMGYHL